MVSETLNLWSNGAVTLPKEWRKQWPTKHFLAEETPEGYLLIKPIVDIEYYEDENGGCGLRFPSGMPMQEFLTMFEEAEKRVNAEEKLRKSRKKSVPKGRKSSTSLKGK